ncbi:MAG: diguanylate cyclase [Solirubrobacteraceae bacterium]|nr:diguanylate cyclase [Solirubrobacteraceae bacterium]
MTMQPQRVMRAGTATEVSVLALMNLVRGGGCLLMAAFPMAPNAPRELLVVLGLVGLATAAALVVTGPFVHPVSLHLVVILHTVTIAVMVAVAVTERGMMISSLGYVWTAVYVALFFGPRAARAYAALMITAFGLALLVARAPADVSVWIVMSVMIWIAVAILINLNARLRAQAHSDALTGLLNRTGFALAAARERALALRSGEPIALVVIDLDHFKSVNDRLGHAAGDRLLIDLATCWSASLRPADLLARFGGDEFVLFLPGATEDQAERLLTRLKRAHPTPWTAGIVLCSATESLTDAIERADARLYAAKASYRDGAARSFGGAGSPAPVG